MRGVICLGVLLATMPLHAADLVTLAGNRVTGTLFAVSAKGVTLRTEAGEVTTPVNEVGAVEFAKPVLPTTSKYDELELVDGSTLRTTKLAIKGKAVELAPLVPGVTVELPLGSLFWLARDAEDAERRKTFAAIVAGRGKRDLFIVRQANGLNPLPGTVLGGNETGDSLLFEREDGQRVNLRLNRATGGLVFNQPPRDVVPPTLCRVSDKAGNRLVAQAVALDGGKVTVTTLAGCIVRYDSTNLLEKLDFAQGNVQYLTALGGRAVYSPGEDDGPLGKLFPVMPAVAWDRAIGGGAITFDGNSFARGVSIPPGTVISYPLDGKFREFRALVGIQDGDNRQSVVMRVRVELDGRAVFDNMVKKTDKPRELAIDVRDAKELRVSVERAGRAFDGDQLNLADARVQK